ncbi:MAG TPA: hypothetical protein VEK08_02415 [Planctomycetota bacterium]|nr:hypothetical protein [Planctomycetota bacterium]
MSWNQLAFVTLLPLTHTALLFVYCRHIYRHSGSKKISFRITDIWAAMVGLTPSLLLATGFSGARMESETLVLAVLVYCLASGQLAGMFVENLDPSSSAWTSAMRILVGAMLGTGLAFGSMAALVIIAALLFVAPLFTLSVLCIGYLFLRRKQPT